MICEDRVIAQVRTGKRRGEEGSNDANKEIVTMGSLGSSELLIILVVLLVLFGGAKLPQLARNLGQAQRELKSGFDEGAEDEA